MDNIAIETVLGNGSAKPAESSADDVTLPTPEQVALICSTWKVVKEEVTLEAAGLILFTK